MLWLHHLHTTHGSGSVCQSILMYIHTDWVLHTSHRASRMAHTQLHAFDHHVVCQSTVILIGKMWFKPSAHWGPVHPSGHEQTLGATHSPPFWQAGLHSAVYFVMLSYIIHVFCNNSYIPCWHVGPEKCAGQWHRFGPTHSPPFSHSGEQIAACMKFLV